MDYKWINPDSDFSDRNLIYAAKAYRLILENQDVDFTPDLPLPRQREVSPKNNCKKYFLTGGTTGDPVKVLHDRKTISSAVGGLAQWIKGAISSFCCLPVHHVSGWMQVERAIMTNGDILFGSYKDLINDNLAKHLTNRFVSLVPTQLNLLLESKQACQNMLAAKGIFVGGASLPYNLELKARQMDIPLLPCYGMTETAGMITLMHSEDFLNGNSGVGHCLPHAEIKIVRNRFSIRSSSLCLKRGDDKILSENWFDTQDTGTYSSESGFQVIGRLDRIIICGGKKINPVTIEDKLKQIPGVASSFVRGEKDNHWGQIAVGYLVPNEKWQGLEEVKNYLKTKVHPYEVPKKWVVTQDLPVNK